MALFRKSSERTEHAYVEERLSAYLDGEVSPRERKIVERHLLGCQACRWNLETLRQTVRWTRELPTVRVPRSFTIPVPARPVRAAHRGWSLPLLQGATALVAVLLFLVVAGDTLLSTFVTAPSPEHLVSRDLGATEVQPPQVGAGAVELTQETEKRAEQVIETVTVIVEVASPAPAAREVPATEAASVGAEAGETPTLESGTMGAMGFFSPTEEGQAAEVEEAAAAPAPAAAPTETKVVTYVVEVTQVPEPTAAPTPALATLAPAALAPTALAAAPEAPAVEAEEEMPRGALQEPLVTVLGVTEIVLTAAFVLLAVTTIVVMLRRRRTG
jgi:anti-sigma factor RsiW